MEEKERIEFIGIGASKSATSWVAEILRKHPGVYYPEEEKELNYFNQFMPQDFVTKNHNYKKPLNWYHHYFRNAKQSQIKGEITPVYLAMENCAEDIYKYNPDVKIFAILRHPIERSFSQYLYSKQNGIGVFKNYQDAIEKLPEKFLHTSLYYQKLKKYFDIFPRENIKILFFEDVKKDNKTFLKELYEFLEVEVFYPEGFDEKVNVGLQPKSQSLVNFIGKAKMIIHSNGLQFMLPFLEKTGFLSLVKKIKKKNMTQRKTKKEQLPENVKKDLQNYFREDLDKLENLLEKDLSHWKK